MQSIREQRHDQIYPTLDPHDIERVRRFGALRAFAAGESLGKSGQVNAGLMIILSGTVAVTEHDPLGQAQTDRRPWRGQYPRRTGATDQPALAGGRERAGGSRSADHSAGAVALTDDC